MNRIPIRLPDRVSRLSLELRNPPSVIAIERIRISEIGKLQLLAGLLVQHPHTMWSLLARGPGSLSAVKAELLRYVAGSQAATSAWYNRYSHGFDYASVICRGSITIAVIMPIYKAKPQWLGEAIRSVVAQTYPHWELICVDDGSDEPALAKILSGYSASDTRVKVVSMAKNSGVSLATNEGLRLAASDYVLLMDHDDMLEPHALARLADAAFAEKADLIFADEVVTTEDIHEIVSVQARPILSHAYYLSHPYFVHPVVVRAQLARDLQGLNPELTISQDVDFVLRALEKARVVTHIPDILYRWRTVPTSTGHQQMAAVMQATSNIKMEHLRRLGFLTASVRSSLSFNTYKIRYFGKPVGRILAIVPTKNRGALLRSCIESVVRTTQGLDVDFAVVDHESEDAVTRAYLRLLESEGRAHIVSYHGPFNFSAINNAATACCGDDYDYYLFLNNDIEASQERWLDAMLDLGMRADVGAVGATLLYPDKTVQHSGVIIGMHDRAEHAYKTLPFGPRSPGYGSGLHATREYSAVTAACMLVPVPVFREVGGFDKSLSVGFNDTDLCLRIRANGYKVINCADALLVHHESVSRGQSLDGRDPHLADTALFKDRYSDLFEQGDPFFNPLLDLSNPTFVLDPEARLSPTVRYRSVINFLPARGARTRL